MNAHYLFPGVTLAAIAAELARELDARLRLYPRRVESGRMTEDERDRELAMCRAWAGDVALIVRMRESAAENWRRFLVGLPEQPLPRPAHTFTWHQRRHALDRELGLRHRFYPEWIGNGRLAKADADRRIACLEALAAIYDDGFDWRASNGLPPSFKAWNAAPDVKQANREWDQHIAAVLERRAPAKQEEMVL